MAKTAKKSAKGKPKRQPPKKSKKSAPMNASFDSVRPVMGRPKKLVMSEQLLMQIRNIGMAWTPQREAAGMLGVSRQTFLDFLDQNPEAKQVWEEAPYAGNGALRSTQLRVALRGNVQMLKWLGMQNLGQANNQRNSDLPPGAGFTAPGDDHFYPPQVGSGAGGVAAAA